MRSWTVVAWVMLLVCAVLALLAQQASAATLKLTHFSVEAYKIEHNDDPYFPGLNTRSYEDEYWTHGAAINWDLDLLRYSAWRWYWRNRNHMSATSAQVRHVGWQWDTGIGWRDTIEGFYWHHSQHALEEQPAGKFPLVDQWGIRMIFIP